MIRPMFCLIAALLFVNVGFQVQAQEVGSIYYDLGVFAYEDEDYKAAEINFQKALAEDSGNPSYNHYMGKTYIKMNQYKKAEKYIKTAWKIDSELPDLAYDRAFLYYKMSKYGKAAKLFKAVVKDDPTHMLANFYGGICLYRDGQYQEANSFLITVAEKSPELKVKASYYAGLCQYYIGQEQEAVQTLSFVMANSDSNVVKSNAAQWIAKIEKGQKERKRYEIQAKIAYMYDDNVPLYDVAEEYSDDADSLIMGHLSGWYHFINRKDLILGAGLKRIQTFHFDLTEFDTTETEFDLYTKYFRNPFIWGLSVLPVIYQVDGDDFLLAYQIRPEASYIFNKQITMRLSYSYFMNDYRQDDYDERDGNTHEIFVDTIYGLKGAKGYVVGSIGYEDNTADEEEYDYGKFTLRAGGSFELPYELRLGVLAHYDMKTYKEEDSFENDTRADNQYGLSLSLTRNLFYEWLEIAAEYASTSNDSNFSDYDYTRQIIGIGVLATY